MPWSAVIAAVLQLVGPLISALLKQWLDGKLKEAAAAAGTPSGVQSIDAGQLLARVESSLWFFQRAKLRFVRETRAAVVPALANGRPLFQTEAGAVKAAALAA